MLDQLIDVNVSLGHWPFQKFDQTTADQLRTHLESEQIAEAWVSSVDAVLFPDPDVYDQPLREQLRPHENLHLVKTINPMLGTWRESLKQAVEEWGVRAVKVFPNYHQCHLVDYHVAHLLEQVVRYDVPLFVQMRVDDERNQYPLMQVPGVPAGLLAQLGNVFPEARILALCAYQSELPALASAANIYADLAFVERATAGGAFPVERLMFGSHTPFLYTRSARMKVDHAQLSDEDKRAVASENARQFFAAELPAGA